MYNLKPAYAQYTDDSLLVSLNKQKSSEKPKTHKKSNAYGLKGIEKQIMAAYKQEVKRVKNLPRCKIPSIETFTKKHLKGINLRKTHKKVNTSASASASASAPETESTPAPSAPETESMPASAPETESMPAESAPETESTPAESASASESEPKTETAAPSIADTLSSMNPFASKPSTEKPKTEGGKKKSRGKKLRGKKSRKNSRKQK